MPAVNPTDWVCAEHHSRAAGPVISDFGVPAAAKCFDIDFVGWYTEFFQEPNSAARFADKPGSKPAGCCESQTAQQQSWFALALADEQPPQLTHPEAAKREEAKPVQTPAMATPENTQPVLPLPDISKPASEVPQNESQPCDQKPEKFLGEVDAIAAQLREKMDEKNQGKQTGMKRPSSCAVLKKPAAKTSKKPVAKKALKEPGASQKTIDVKPEKPPNALKMYPKGAQRAGGNRDAPPPASSTGGSGDS